MPNQTMYRTALRLTGAITLATMAACSDKGPTGVNDTPLLRQNSSASGAKDSTKAPKAAEVKTVISLAAPATEAPFAGASGKAKFESKGTQRELEIEVEHLPAGTAVVFVFDGASIGTGTANALGAAELDLNSKHVATVPTAVAGKAVSVTTTAGAVIVSGTF
jgi:hypothetical protein